VSCPEECLKKLVRPQSPHRTLPAGQKIKARGVLSEF
jgi:hypothetical protein